MTVKAFRNLDCRDAQTGVLSEVPVNSFGNLRHLLFQSHAGKQIADPLLYRKRAVLIREGRILSADGKTHCQTEDKRVKE